MEQTLAMIKPDAVKAHVIGKIIDRIESEGFTIHDLKMLTLTVEQAQRFYDVHRDKPFFDDLVAFMSSGPVVALALERDNAVKHWRSVMGATNPADAEEGTLRKLHGTSIDNNAVHGSDSIENGQQEVGFFFPHLV